MTTIVCESACTVTLQHELVNPLFSLTPEQGAMIAAAVVGVWAVGFAFRCLIRAMNVDRLPMTADD